MARKNRVQVFKKGKKANHGRKPCNGKVKSQFR